jgi:hypothetical protein
MAILSQIQLSLEREHGTTWTRSSCPDPATKVAIELTARNRGEMSERSTFYTHKIIPTALLLTLVISQLSK